MLLQLNGVWGLVAPCHIQNILLSNKVRIESESAACNNQHLMLLQLNGVLVLVTLCHLLNILLSSQVRIKSESAACNN